MNTKSTIHILMTHSNGRERKHLTKHCVCMDRSEATKPNTRFHIERKTLDENIHAIEFIPGRKVKNKRTTIHGKIVPPKK